MDPFTSCYSWVNQRKSPIQWPCSIAFSVFTRGYVSYHSLRPHRNLHHDRYDRDDRWHCGSLAGGPTELPAIAGAKHGGKMGGKRWENLEKCRGTMGIQRVYIYI